MGAVGDSEGAITLLSLCDSLVKPGPNEKGVIGMMLERETKREKNLEAIKKQGGKAKKEDDPTTAQGHQSVFLSHTQSIYFVIQLFRILLNVSLNGDEFSRSSYSANPTQGPGGLFHHFFYASYLGPC